MERSFVEVWSLSFDDIGLVERINRSGRFWYAFQLSFFQEWARFPSRPGDVQADVLRYLAEQLGIADQEISALALQLVQASMVYVNTRMVQSVLSDPEWQSRLSPEDYRGLTPLIYPHINPYGRFEVDLNKRIDFERMAA